MKRQAGLALCVVLCVLAASACNRTGLAPPPIVSTQRFGSPHEGTALVAVVPFMPSRRLSVDQQDADLSAAEAAEIVTRIMTEALQRSGIAVIPAADVEVAFIGAGLPVPRADARTAARVAERKFGATGVLLGQVGRYREREGEALGATRPASVSFMVTLHGAPHGNRLWRGQFDQTQKPLSSNVLVTHRYPGRGTRWLTASELARWGADEITISLEGAQ